ncbi:uncharacterized protein CCOS01_03678 [Colletotrichum costaricense]|uniref:Uncharacterized protein n=1 Tax=Colletotrichum costaricense TaxID=1209916 RepID=A0AAI9Z592_9PEZI|nr:uncharacterized protein CCOS01_03678 [Colletotrichum costaricense]KAK1534926.1 hypothetical protein CCOS01_03678 [Colletotrichum costaricense]
MDNVSEAEELKRWLHEIRGQSSDRPYRAMHEALADDLITALYEYNSVTVEERCAPDVTLLVDIKVPGQIFHGLEEVAQYFERNPGIVSEAITIVDRFRITTVVEFIQEPGKYSKRFKQRRLIILDINNDHKVIRIEMRPVGPKESVDPDARIPYGSPSISIDNSL